MWAIFLKLILDAFGVGSGRQMGYFPLHFGGHFLQVETVGNLSHLFFGILRRY